MGYEIIDKILNELVKKNGLTIYTQCKDGETRSLDITTQGKNGKSYQIWINPPEKEEFIVIHIWNRSLQTTNMKLKQINPVLRLP